MENAIEIKGLTKAYDLEIYKQGFLGAFLPYSPKEADLKYAFKDLNLTVKKGEIIGVIGNNGSGKSSLLKVLSGVTPPTSGEVNIYGKVISLLEVGTGFHPELTGNENIYYYGAIMGMTKDEIYTKYNDIVEYSELKENLDIPIKKYSSGMKMRLAFSVAIHLDADILLLDEVLAVGDLNFRRKCFKSFYDLSLQGKTMIIVSHNLNFFQFVSTRTLVFENGKIIKDGNPNEVIDYYIDRSQKPRHFVTWKEGEEPGSKFIKINTIKVYQNDSIEIYNHNPFNIDINFELLQNVERYDFKLLLKNYKGGGLLCALDSSDLINLSELKKGFYEFTLTFPKNILNKGVFNIEIIGIESKKYIDMRINDIITFKVLNKEKGVSFLNKNNGSIYPIIKTKLNTLR